MDERRESGVRYETETIFTEEAVWGLFRAQFLLFEKLRIWSRVAMGAVLTAFGFSSALGTPQRVLCIALGVWLLLGWNTVAKARADAVLKQRGDAEAHVIYRFAEEEIQIEDSASWHYEELMRLARDEQRFYLFRNPQTAVVVDMRALQPADAAGFAGWVEQKSGKKFRALGAGFPLFWNRKKKVS